MRIAYIAPYQGATLVKQRPIVINRSLSSKVKIELIARLLCAKAHSVEILSQGEVVETGLRFYPALSESEPLQPKVPVYYASALPIRRLNGFWSSLQMLRLFQARHRRCRYDLVLIYNLKRPQITCANYATRRLGLPVILEYEDDAFLSIVGQTENGFVARRHQRDCSEVLKNVSGGIAVSPHVLAQFPAETPKLLLRGVVGEDVINGRAQSGGTRQNRVLFSGTHYKSNGVAQLIQAWGLVNVPGWELHITGYGEMTETLRSMAQGQKGVVFHGLVEREQLVQLMCSAKICVTPHDVSHTPGNVFPFKIIEYLAAGAHVITTPMGRLEPEIEQGLTYMVDNAPATIAATLARVIETAAWKNTAANHVSEAYGPGLVAKSLDGLLERVIRSVAVPAPSARA